MTPQFFYLLLTLVDGVKHGYAMAREVQERSEGAIQLGPGSLYWSLHRLAEAGLIEETKPKRPRTDDDERRRYYCLTPLGRQFLQRETRTLARVVRFAKAKGVL